jgi:hypothetical protein
MVNDHWSYLKTLTTLEEEDGLVLLAFDILDFEIPAGVVVLFLVFSLAVGSVIGREVDIGVVHDSPSSRAMRGDQVFRFSIPSVLATMGDWMLEISIPSLLTVRSASSIQVGCRFSI